MTSESNILKRLFSSGLRVSVLSYFYMHTGESVHVRNLANLIDESAGNLARELANLETAGILQSRMVGNQKHFTLREDSPIYEDLKNLFLKTAGVGGEIRTLLSSVNDIELAFLYGSFASGEADSTSDIDVMIIGNIDDKALAPLMAELEGRLHREINYVIYPRQEAEERIQEDGDFISEVFKGPRVMLVGRADDGLF